MADQNNDVCDELNASDEIKTGILNHGDVINKAVEFCVIDGMAVFEGDIVLGPPESLVELEDDNEGSEGIRRTGDQFLWPGGVVAYTIDPALPRQSRISDAITHWEANTVLRFVERTTEQNFITFRTSTGCSSRVGMIGGQQFINLGDACTTGNTIHEIGHAIGLWHEQSREDRNDFVEIDFANIQPSRLHNFNQHIIDGDDIGDYDYGSIMHYPANAFAIDRSRPTIITEHPIGQRDGLSPGDIATVNSMYQPQLSETAHE